MEYPIREAERTTMDAVSSHVLSHLFKIHTRQCYLGNPGKSTNLQLLYERRIFGYCFVVGRYQKAAVATTIFPDLAC